MQKTNIIPIVLACDCNYLAPTYLTVFSMLKNKKINTLYHIYILTNMDAIEKGRLYFEQLKSIFDNFDIRFIDMNNQFSDVDTKSDYITNATFFRLLLPKILLKYSTCLYLDTDIVVKKDLSVLFNENINDCYIAGVREMPIFTQHYKEIPLPSNNQYINAGVLIINLNEMRKDKLIDKFMNCMQHHYLYHDQDILNYTCYNKIYQLPLKYNAMIKLFYRFNDTYTDHIHAAKFYEQSVYQEAKEDPVIIHFCAPFKPWWGKVHPCLNIWWDYYDLIPKNVKKGLFVTFLRKEHRGLIYKIKRKLRKILDIIKNL